MIKIIKQGYIKPQYVVECSNCKTQFTFNNDDTEFVNIKYSTEQYVRCPYCGKEIYDRYWNEIKEAE